MFQFIGYNFLGGAGVLNNAPTVVDNIKSTKLTNAVFDHFNIDKDITKFGDITIPEWDIETILNASFNNSISAGNLEYMVNQISGIKIKRRIKGAFDWITLKYIPVVDINSLTFSFNDFLNAYGVEYEYALVPIVSGIEGDYIINSIMSKFSGVFIGDAEQSFKFLYDVNYASNARNQQVGTFMPLGREYPIIVANGVLSYESGNFTGTIVDEDYEETRQIDKVAITKKKNAVKNYLTNKKPKILKDWNGNMWLIMIVDNVQMNYRPGSSMAIPQVNFNWVQVGDANNQQDLYDNGITEIYE